MAKEIFTIKDNGEVIVTDHFTACKYFLQYLMTRDEPELRDCIKFLATPLAYISSLDERSAKAIQELVSYNPFKKDERVS